MTGKKDKPALNNLIIELAKANDWLSRDDLKEITGKPVKTIKVYLQKDIFNFIDTKDFIELVNRNTGQGKTNIEKYKLKSGLDNLSSIFNYLNDKNYQKQLMQTDYYRNLIPEIKEKSKIDFKLNDHTSHNLFKIYEIKRIVSGALNSPTAVNFLLKVNNEILEKAQIEVQKSFKDASYKKMDSFIMILIGLTYSDMIDEIITPSEYVASLTPVETIKSQTSEQS